jgi:mRNA interferase RelE/StbE
LVSVKWSQRAVRDLEKLDKPIARRVLRRITWLSSSFHRTVPEALSGPLKGTFKLRVGDWRAVYTLEADTIVIRFVGHRSEIYEPR